MLAIIVLLVFITTFIFAHIFLKPLFAPQMRIQNRIDGLDDQIIAYDVRDDEMNQSLATRVFGPAIEGFGKVVLKMSPQSKRDRLESLLRRSGKMDNGSVGKWYLKKLVFAFLLPVALGFGMYYAGNSLLITFVQAASLAFLIQFFQNFMLKRSIGARKREITNRLPDALDLITVSVEAGLSFDGAVDRVIRQMPNALSQELAIALKEMRMGKTRRESLKALSERCEVDDLTTLTGALIQADDLGVAIGKVLRIQSQVIREKRRQRAREKAMKAPIKLLFPLIFFIFPTVFVVLLGPAVINMIEVFGK